MRVSLLWVGKALVHFANDNMSKIEEKGLREKSELKEFQFLTSHDQELRKL